MPDRRQGDDVTHQLARAVEPVRGVLVRAVLALAVLVVGSTSPAAAVERQVPTGPDITHHDGAIVKRTSQALCCQARPAGLDYPMQLAPPTRTATLPRSPARLAHPGRSDLAPPAGPHPKCADSRAPPRMP